MGVTTELMLPYLGVREYTISILNSPLYRLQAGVPCARGGKRGHRAHAEGPRGHGVHDHRFGHLHAVPGLPAGRQSGGRGTTQHCRRHD